MKLSKYNASGVDIAFITVNYNTKKLVEDLIIFFKTTSLPFSYTLVVVDNNSTDGSKEMLEAENWESLLYIQANKNLGYGRGMNRGLQAIQSKYACIMNTDLVLNMDALTKLWNLFENKPDAGVASPIILGSDNRIQGFLYLPGVLPMYFETLAKIRSKLWKLKVQKGKSPFKVPGVMGAFFMIRRSMFTDTLFDEDFFFYYEDTELAHRYYNQSIACYVLTDTSITHLGGASTSINSRKMFYKSQDIYLNKCLSFPHNILLKKLSFARLKSKFYKYKLLSLFTKNSNISEKLHYYSCLIK